MKLFHYLSPKIIPLFSRDTGETVFASFVQRALDTRSSDKKFTGMVSVAITSYCDGEIVERRENDVAVTDGKAETDIIWSRAHAPRLGYAEIELMADKPLFQKIWPETGYALFAGADGRCVTMVHDMKYANYLIVQQIKTWNTYCMLHSAAYVDPDRDCGNSMIFINPYESPIVAVLKGEEGRQLKARIPSKAARMISLESIVKLGQFSTVMLSGNNRIIAYDVRHRYADPMAFNSVDHLDTFNGIATRHPVPFAERVRQIARTSARRLGLRYV